MLTPQFGFLSSVKYHMCLGFYEDRERSKYCVPLFFGPRLRRRGGLFYKRCGLFVQVGAGLRGENVNGDFSGAKSMDARSWLCLEGNQTNRLLFLDFPVFSRV